MIISIPLAVYICVPRLLTRQMWKTLRGRSANGLLYYIRLPQVSMRSVLVVGWGAPIAPLNPHCIVYVYSCRADFPGRLPSAQPRREATCLAMALRRPTVFDRYQWVKTREATETCKRKDVMTWSHCSPMIPWSFRNSVFMFVLKNSMALYFDEYKNGWHMLAWKDLFRPVSLASNSIWEGTEVPPHPYSQRCPLKQHLYAIHVDCSDQLDSCPTGWIEKVSPQEWCCARSTRWIIIYGFNML